MEAVLRQRTSLPVAGSILATPPLHVCEEKSLGNPGTPRLLTGHDPPEVEGTLAQERAQLPFQQLRELGVHTLAKHEPHVLEGEPAGGQSGMRKARGKYIASRTERAGRVLASPHKKGRMLQHPLRQAPWLPTQATTLCRHGSKEHRYAALAGSSATYQQLLRAAGKPPLQSVQVYLMIDALFSTSR